jgi:DNA-binding protein YbaB
MSSEVNFNAGTPDALNTTNISNVTLEGIPCRLVPAKFKGRYNDSSDINYPTKTDPVYFIENNTIDMLPDTGVGRYSELQYPTIEYNHTDIGAINLIGVVGEADDDTFTKASHGLAEGDRVQISNVTGQSSLNGFIGVVDEGETTNTFKIVSLNITTDITDCNITKMGGFPDEAVYLLVLYAAMKGLQYKMAFLMNETVNTQDLDAIVTLMDSAVDRIDADLWTDTALFDPDDNETSLIMVRSALDNAKTRIETTATSHLTNEDIELVKSAIDLGSAELQRASAHLKEWDTIAATALKEAQGYADVIKTRMSKMAQEYGWYEKQYVILKEDYMKGLSALGARVGGQKK